MYTVKSDRVLPATHGELKQHLLLGSDRLFNEALKQALVVESSKPAGGQPARLREVARAPFGMLSQPAERRRNE
jgi:hypothetical protein